MCTTSVSIAEINERLDAPPSADAMCHSPSSIAEVDYSRAAASEQPTKRRKISCADSPALQTHHPAPLSPRQGDDDLLRACAARDAVSPEASDAKDINARVARDLSCAPTRKRRLSQQSVSADDVDIVVTTSTAVLTTLEPTTPCEPAAAACAPSTDSSEPTAVPTPKATGSATSCESSESVVSHDAMPRCKDDAGTRADNACGSSDGVAAAAAAGSCSPAATRASRRTLYIEYWSRTDECKERKWDHLDAIAEQYGCAEDHIFDTTLRGRTACLEPNMFPYDTPAGIEHWTLWHVRELSHSQIKQYVENWIDANAPHVESWNYDDNPERSIDIFHVHVYLQVPHGASVLHGRVVDDLVHEMD